MALLGSFAGLALFLAMLGLYSVISYAVTQRTPEIGVRVALGAHTRDILTLVLRQGVVLAVGGIVVGLVGAFVFSQLMANLLYGVEPTDAMTIAAVCGALFTAALMASYFPARRALRVDPVTALRHE